MSTTIIHKFYFSFFFFFKKEITTAIIINKNKPIITQPPGSKLAKKSIYITSFYLTIKYISSISKKTSYQYSNADGYSSSSSSFPIPFG